MRRILFQFLVAFCPAFVSPAVSPEPETVRVLCHAGADSALGLDFVTEIARRCGCRIETVRGAAGEATLGTSKPAADIVAAGFITPGARQNWRFIPSRIGTGEISIYARAQVASSLTNDAPCRWPRQKLALAKDESLANFDCRDWMQATMANVEEVEFPNRRSAVEAVLRGGCQLYLGESSGESADVFPAERKPRIVRVATVSSHPYFIGVRNDRRDLYDRFSAALEDLVVNDAKTVDAILRRRCGKSPSSKRVRVARYSEPGLCEMTGDGQTRGANQEVIDCIADIAGWEVEWVDCRYVTALKGLEDGAIDVVAGVTLTDERRRKLLFPMMSSGNYTDYLFCRRGASYRSEYYDDWKGAAIACGPGGQSNAMLKRFVSENGIDCRIRPYPTCDEAVNAYYRGECQLLYCAGAMRFANEKTLHIFPTVPSYVCVSPRRPELVKELQSALERINDLEPDFFRKVAARNFLGRDTIGFHLNEEENVFVRHMVINGDSVKLEIFPELYPLKYWEEGGAGGYVNHLAELLSRRTGLRFQFLEPVDLETARRRFMDGECDFWLDYAADTTGMSFSSESINSVKLRDVVICRKDVFLADPCSGRIAVPIWQLKDYGDFRKNGFRREMLRPYGTIDECVRAVRRGDADATITSVFVAASLIKQNDEDGVLEIRSFDQSRLDLPFRLVPSPSANPILVNIVRKALLSLSQSELGTVESATMVSFVNYSWSFTDGLLRWLVRITGLVLVIVLAVTLFRVRRYRAELELRERRSRHRDNYVLNSARDLELTVERIASRAEFLRNPGINRELSLQWTGEILAFAEDMVSRFHKFIAISEKYADDAAKLEKIRGGGVKTNG